MFRWITCTVYLSTCTCSCTIVLEVWVLDTALALSVIVCVFFLALRDVSQTWRTWFSMRVGLVLFTSRLHRHQDTGARRRHRQQRSAGLLDDVDTRWRHAAAVRRRREQRRGVRDVVAAREVGRRRAAATRLRSVGDRQRQRQWVAVCRHVVGRPRQRLAVVRRRAVAAPVDVGQRRPPVRLQPAGARRSGGRDVHRSNAARRRNRLRTSSASSRSPGRQAGARRYLDQLDSRGGRQDDQHWYGDARLDATAAATAAAAGRRASCKNCCNATATPS